MNPMKRHFLLWLQAQKSQQLGSVTLLLFMLIVETGMIVAEKFTGNVALDNLGIGVVIASAVAIWVTKNRSLQKLHTLLAQIPLPIGFSNENKEVYFNECFKRTFGYTAAELSTLEQWFLLAYPDENYRQFALLTWQAAVEKSMAQGTEIETQEYRITCKNGELKTMLISGVVVEKSVIILFVDVTAQKKVETELREMNRDFVTFLENTTDFVYFKDAESRIRFCSQTLATITHHASWQDLKGKHDFEIFPPETAMIYHTEEFPVFKDGTPLINKIDPYYNQDGSKGWVSTSKWPVFDYDNQKVIGIFGMSRDVTQLKTLSQSLQESERMLKEAQEIAHLGHWMLDYDAQKLYMSDEVYRILEILPRAAETDYLNFLEYVHPEDRALVNESYQQHLVTQTDYALEYRLLLANATVKYVAAKYKTEFDATRRPIRSMGVVLDITERKQAEVLLQKKTAALLQSNADLEQFAYSVSHDMRQPLRSISGHLQLLSRSLASKIDDEEKIALNFALDGAKRMDAMILSLLDYSRVGRKTESKIWQNNRLMLDEALAFLRPAIQEAKIDIHIRGDWGDIFVSHDEITRLLLNLIGNAIKYREPSHSPVIEIESVMTKQIWRVSIRDYGIGISPEQVSRLFKFFSRLQSRTRFEGTGMGLALCRRIVEHHGGKIWGESAGEGQGSCFIFELPLYLQDGEKDLAHE